MDRRGLEVGDRRRGERRGRREGLKRRVEEMVRRVIVENIQFYTSP